MSKILDRWVEGEVADEIIEFINECGWKPEEAIPGLVSAVRFLSASLPDTEQVLDEVVELLEEEEE